MNELMPNPGEKKAAKEKKTVRCQVDFLGGIPYAAHGAQIPPPLIMYAYFMLG